MSDTYTPRTRTAPDLKWLLNERAAVAGARASGTAHIESLQTRMASALRRVQRIEQALATASLAVRACETKLAALDRTIELAHPDASPSALGDVRAWAGKYGKRGGLRNFVIQTLRSSYPEPVSMSTLTDSVSATFGLVLETRKQRGDLQRSIRGALGILKAQEKVTALHGPRAAVPGQWKWIADELPAFQELAQRAAAARGTRRARDEAAHADASSH